MTETTTLTRNGEPLGRFFAWLHARRGDSEARFLVQWLVIGLALQVAFSVAFGWALPDQPANPEAMLERRGWVYLLVAGLIVAPLLETLLHQKLILGLLLRWRIPLMWAILLDASIFAALHLYNIRTALVTFPMGLVLDWAYVAWLRDSKRKAYWMAASLHSLRNLIAAGILWFS